MLLRWSGGYVAGTANLPACQAVNAACPWGTALRPTAKVALLPSLQPRPAPAAADDDDDDDDVGDRLTVADPGA